MGSRWPVPRPLTSSEAAPGENGYIESFNARLRDELLNGEIFYTLREAQIVIESWRRHYKRASQHHLIQDKSGLTALRQFVAGKRNTVGNNRYEKWPAYDVSEPRTGTADLPFKCYWSPRAASCIRPKPANKMFVNCFAWSTVASTPPPMQLP
jgi:Integrase core domain